VAVARNALADPEANCKLIMYQIQSHTLPEPPVSDLDNAKYNLNLTRFFHFFVKNRVSLTLLFPLPPTFPPHL